jgi:hypothetical protein
MPRALKQLARFCCNATIEIIVIIRLKYLVSVGRKMLRDFPLLVLAK